WESPEHQQRITALKEDIERLIPGFRIWMDRDNMAGNINKDMAAGIVNCSVVIACLSRKYLDSHNTLKEINFADQLRRPIACARFFHEPDDVVVGYTRDAALNAAFLITANVLYASFKSYLPGTPEWEVGVETVVKQIKKLVPRFDARAVTPSSVSAESDTTVFVRSVSEWPHPNDSDALEEVACPLPVNDLALSILRQNIKETFEFTVDFEVWIKTPRLPRPGKLNAHTLQLAINIPARKWYGDDMAPWGRSKLMMIGEGGSGKTSTVRSFLGEDFVPQHLSTLGGDVSKSCSVFFKESISASGWTVETTNNDLLVQMAKVESKKHSGGGSNGEFLSGILKDHTGKAEVVPNISESTPMAVLPGQTADSIFLNSIEEPVMTVREFDKSLVAQVDATSEEKITLSLWDFGGQEVFYSMHHAFLTAKGVYCLCFKLTDLCGPYATVDTVERCLKYLKFWLISVRMHAESAPIFLVGTHKDKLPPNYELKTINALLLDRLEDMLFSRDVKRKEEESGRWTVFWAVDNSRGLNDSTLFELRGAIVDSIRSADYVTGDVPTAWIKAYHRLLSLRVRYTHWSLRHTTLICRQYGIPEEHVVPMLEHLNDLGVLVYFSSNSLLQSQVILEPQWLISCFSEVVHDLDIHFPKAWNDNALLTTLNDDILVLKRTAVVSEDLLCNLWKHHKNSATEDENALCHKNSATEDENALCKFLIGVMRHLSLLAVWKDQREKLFLVPSMINNKSIHSNFRPALFMDIAFYFKDKPFLPTGYFPLLLAVMVEYAGEIGERSGIPMLSKSLAVISFGTKRFQLELLSDGSAIIRLGVSKASDLEFIRLRLMSMLNKITEETMGNRLRHEMLLLVEAEGNVRVKFEEAEKEWRHSNKEIWATDEQTLVSTNLLQRFFCGSPETVTEQTLASSEFKYHIFLSYLQKEAIDACTALCHRLNEQGLKVWFDQRYEDNQDNLNADAMKRGVEESRVYLLFLTKSVFSSEYVKMELKRAVDLKRKILFVHEEDQGQQGFAPFKDYIQACPPDLQHLFEKVESIPYRRRLHESDGMCKEILRRAGVEGWNVRK
ncbi:hypothetical protein HDU83_005582, partial [Entophlyctis luteolus]